jgi:transposase
MFQDEARFGRISDPRSCWAPSPVRPMVELALVREFMYEYASISPKDGALDFMPAEKMNTVNMSRFLAQVRRAHRRDFIVMILDGASSHKSKDLVVPCDMEILFLPPYSPELNPAEQIWNVLRKSKFANRVFDSLDSAMRAAKDGLSQMAKDRRAMKRLSGWPWILSAIMNA